MLKISVKWICYFLSAKCIRSSHSEIQLSSDGTQMEHTADTEMREYTGTYQNAKRFYQIADPPEGGP